MSVAMNAASVDFSSNLNENSSSDGAVDKRRQARNKTYKRRDSPEPSSKVADMQRKLGLQPMENDQGDMSNFSPPPKPVSMGAMRREENETDILKDVPVQPNTMESGRGESAVTPEGFASLPSTSTEDYYRQFVPYYDKGGSSAITKDELASKLDYLIYLLEEQKDVKTGHVTEEIILYSFLGIFIIFVLDSFARAGKYTR